MPAQISILDEIIVDNFAGGGGASTGIELATGRPVTIAINHDPAAILMHRTNHPYTEHLQASVWDVDPEEVCAGRPVGLAWFSPDCKHFSKAKGSALVDRNIRGLAWIVLRWAGTVRPRVIILENVEEFTTWGPVRKGKPVKKKAGTTFQKWLRQLEGCGYDVEYRELVAADYGAPTTRKRFVLIARCDGQPIRWPERTHAPIGSPEVESGKLLPWRSAAEIIDWSVPMYSIFATRKEIKEKYGVNAVRPLADNTLRRIIRGVDKFTIQSERPFVLLGDFARNGEIIRDPTIARDKDGQSFIVPTGYGERKGQAPRVHDINAPVPTVVSTCKQNLAQPVLRPFTADCNHAGDGHIADVTQPIDTVTQKCTKVVVSPILAPITMPNTCNSVGHAVDQPVYTVTSAGNQILAAVNLMSIGQTGGGDRIRDLRDPSPTTVSKQEACLVAANLVQYHAEKGNGGTPRAASPTEPLFTIDGSNRHALVTAQLAEYYGNGQPIDIRQPMRTVTSHDRECLTEAFLQPYHAGGYHGKGNSPEAPLNTITSSGGQRLCAAHVVKFKGTNLGQTPNDPLQTITASMGEFAACAVRTVRYEPGAELGYWPEVRALLNQYCGYSLADDEILLIWLCGSWHYIRDITMRMLTPRELYAAMGFPPDYIIDRDYTGKPYRKNQQVARCGNAVCPQMATAVVRANLPEWCQITYVDMASLMQAMAI
jgi:DNA (cytosine-5)-methyltransferase 1